MAILDRIRRVAKANITQFLNQMEAPEDEIISKIHELEEASRLAKDALASFAVTYKRLEKNVYNLTDSCAAWKNRAESALKQGDETSARRALRERIKEEERLASLRPVLESRRQTYEELKEDLMEIHDQLNQARARMADLRARKRAAEAEQAMGRHMDSSGFGTDESLDSFEENVLESEAHVEIERSLRGELKPLDKRLDKEQKEQKIDEELEALKKELSREGNE